MKNYSVTDSLGEAFVAYYENKLSQEQSEELILWLAEDEDNRKYFQDWGKLWYASGLLKKGKADQEKGWANLLDRIREIDERPVPRKSLRIPVRSMFLAAASLTLLIAIGSLAFFLLGKPGAKHSGGFYEALAPKGSRSVITLTDGSKIWLNSGTKLIYPAEFGSKSRDLTLEGEAYFIVAANKSLPFRVKAGDVCITALGTAFNVKAYNEENVVETTLEKGEVVVERMNGAEKMPVTHQVVLKPNQKAVFVKSSGSLSVNGGGAQKKTEVQAVRVKPAKYTIKVDTLVDTKLSTSWKDSKWIFKSEVLHDLVPILERRYDIRIVFRDTVLNNYKFTGTLKEESLEQVLKAMTLAAPIRYEVSHNSVFLSVDQSYPNKYSRQFN